MQMFDSFVQNLALKIILKKIMLLKKTDFLVEKQKIKNGVL
jgi:hypothetical protein